jgi:hypothetical protein
LHISDCGHTAPGAPSRQHPTAATGRRQIRTAHVLLTYVT